MPAWITAGMIAYILLLPILGYGFCNFLLMLLCLRLYEAPWLESGSVRISRHFHRLVSGYSYGCCGLICRSDSW